MFEKLDYIREEGRFKWNDKLTSKFHKNLIGQYAGVVRYTDKTRTKTMGRRINIENKEYADSTVVWFFEYGEFPPSKLFFRDGNNLNCHISNLSIYKDPLETSTLKRCVICNEYKNRDDDFSKLKSANKRYINIHAYCKACASNKNTKHAKNRTDEEKVEKRKRDNERYRSNRAYEHFLNQLEEEDQTC